MYVWNISYKKFYLGYACLCKSGCLPNKCGLVAFSWSTWIQRIRIIMPRDYCKKKTLIQHRWLSLYIICLEASGKPQSSTSITPPHLPRTNTSQTCLQPKERLYVALNAHEWWFSCYSHYHDKHTFLMPLPWGQSRGSDAYFKRSLLCRNILKHCDELLSF